MGMLSYYFQVRYYYSNIRKQSTIHIVNNNPRTRTAQYNAKIYNTTKEQSSLTLVVRTIQGILFLREILNSPRAGAFRTSIAAFLADSGGKSRSSAPRHKPRRPAKVLSYLRQLCGPTGKNFAYKTLRVGINSSPVSLVSMRASVLSFELAGTLQRLDQSCRRRSS